MTDIFLLVTLFIHIFIACKFFVTIDFSRFTHAIVSIISYLYATAVLDIPSAYLFSLLLLLLFDFFALLIIKKKVKAFAIKKDFFALTACLLLIIPLIQPTINKLIT